MFVFRFAGMTLLGATLALTSVACDSDDKSLSSANIADGGDDGTGETVTVSLTLWDLVEDQTLAGVEVCIYPKLTDCKTTDEEGKTSLLLPANSETGFLVDGTAIDYTKVLATKTTSSEDFEDELSIASNATAEEFADLIGYKLEPDKGILIGQAGNADWSAGATGVTMTLTPSAGVGPVYFNEDGVPDANAKATTAGGGSAIFTEVPPGEYTLTFEGKNCLVETFAWKAGENGAASIPALASTRTNAAVRCED